MEGERVPVTGKVARVIGSREVVINRGQQHGVTLGMIFAILDPKAQDIKDPDTNEVIGSIFRPKVYVKTTRVEDRISVAATYRAITVNVGGHAASWTGMDAISKMLLPPKYVERPETFKTTEAAWEDIAEADSYVKTGDPVEEVIEDVLPD